MRGLQKRRTEPAARRASGTRCRRCEAPEPRGPGADPEGARGRHRARPSSPVRREVHAEAGVRPGPERRDGRERPVEVVALGIVVPLIRSSRGWQRRCAVHSAKYVRSASCAAIPRSQRTKMLMSSIDQRWKRAASRAGRPRMRAMTRTGNTNVRRRTRSACPTVTISSSSSSTTRRTRSSRQRASSFGRNAGAIRARCARCSGSSMAIMAPSSTGAISSASTSDEYVASSRKTSMTSS